MNKDSVIAYATRLGILLDLSRSNNRWLNGSCPLAPWTHERGTDSNPSFGITYNDEGKRSGFNCYSCKHQGSFAKLASMLARFSDNKKFSRIAAEIEAAESDVGKQLPKFEDTFYHIQEAPAAKPQRGGHPLAAFVPEALRYLKQRGVSLHTAIALDLRYSYEDKRVLFNVFDEHNSFAGYTGRLIDKRSESSDNPKVRDYHGLKKKSLLLFAPGGPLKRPFYRKGADMFPGFSEAIIVVEGLLDFARMYSLGFQRTVALMGSVVTKEKQQILERWSKPVIWMTDADQAGYACLHGPYDPISETHKYTEGALWKMRTSVVQHLVKYPGVGLDPGSLELSEQEIVKMIRKSSLFLHR